MTNIKIKSELFNDVLHALNNFHKSHTFQYGQMDEEDMQVLDNILMDISLAIENGDGYITVEESVVKGLNEMGAFSSMEGV